MKPDELEILLARDQGLGWLRPWRNAFLGLLASLGMKVKTIKDYARAVDWFCAEVERRGRKPNDMNGAILVQFQCALPTRLSACGRRSWKSLLARFIDYLVEQRAIAAAPQPQVPVPTALDALCGDYRIWLCVQRGLAPKTIRLRQRELRNFLCFRFGEAASGDLNAIPRQDIIAYLGKLDETGIARGTGYKAMSLRSLFGFLYATSRIERNLAFYVPRMTSSRAAAPIRHLTPAEVERILHAARGESTVARRNYAMLLTMARLGLRGEEVIAIRLEDIDWRAGEMQVRGKGRKHAVMPMPVDVGEAVADWIQHGRRGDSRHLFISVRPPFLPFTSSLSVRVVLRKAYAASGVTPPGGEVRCHVFRHSLAMSLVQSGTPLAEIGNLLRHQSAKATTVYARQDIEALRSLARPWPEPEIGS